MKKETLYLDTSVISAYYDKRTKEHREITIKFWKQLLPDYKVYISEITMEEIENTKEEQLKKNFTRLIEGFRLLKKNDQIQELARLYVEKGIFPERYIDDAIHVAMASFYEISYLVSWNFEHMVKVKTRKLVNSLNTSKGFKQIEIISPQEL